MKRGATVGGIVFAVYLARLAGAQTPAPDGVIGPAAVPPDVVMLQDGGLVRGTIVELRQGDVVVIQILGGEVRTYPMASVKFAGPSGERPTTAPLGPPQAQAPVATGAVAPVTNPDLRPAVVVHAQEARLSFRADQKITFHRRDAAGISSVGTYVAAYSQICTAPCEGAVGAGVHTFALSLRGGGPVEARAVTVPAGAWEAVGTYKDRSATRTAGLLLAIASIGGGLAIALSGSSSTTNIAVGTGVGVVGGSIGGVMTAMEDEADVEIKAPSPSAPSSPARVGAPRMAQRRAPLSLRFTGTF